MSNSSEVTIADLHDLLLTFEKKSFEAASCAAGSLVDKISRKCELLYKLDYSLVVLDNVKGSMSSRYPRRILIPEYEHGYSSKANTTTNGSNNTNGSQTGDVSGNSSGDENSTGSGIQAFVSFAGVLQSDIDANYTEPPAPTNQQQAQQQQQQQRSPQQQQRSPQQQQRSPQQQQRSPQQQHQQSTIYEDLYDIGRMRELIPMAKYARCRQRFVVPVMMYRGKYICRSATLSLMSETYGRKVVDAAFGYIIGTNNSAAPAPPPPPSPPVENETDGESTDESLNTTVNEQSQFSYYEVLRSDIQLLNILNVSTIVDLMVEKRKIKYFMAVSSSEKADPAKQYESFNLLSLPYPGCEFFKDFRDNNYQAKNLFYDWKQPFNDADLRVPNGPAVEMDINWSEYRKWDLVNITQNYLKATLKYIQEDNSGVLIHCISGWDRTPLFISLVRLSLWADGLIHQSMSAMQMTYFTLAYDWYLFGHQLPNRLKYGEDIMFFCFHVLKYLTDDEFSIVEHRKRTKTSSSSGSSVVVPGVPRPEPVEEEPPREDYILNFDQDSNDSFSNCSICDMSITDNFYATTTGSANLITNRSPNPKRSRTSPISVPGARQRQESTSSNGSWQVVTDTGSIDSTLNGSYMNRFAALQVDNSNIPTGNNNSGCCKCNPSNSGASGSSDSSGNSNAGNACCAESSCSSSSNGSAESTERHGVPNSSSHEVRDLTTTATTMRKQRLRAVRANFVQAYGKTIGMKFQEGSSMNLTSFIGTLADTLF